eukprot:768759-Hanusia_phi.AAC.4
MDVRASRQSFAETDTKHGIEERAARADDNPEERKLSWQALKHILVHLAAATCQVSRVRQAAAELAPSCSSWRCIAVVFQA